MIKKLLAVVAAAFLLGACDEPAPQAAAPPPPPPVKNFLVFFDFDKSTLTPRAMDIVKEAAAVAKSGQNARLTCTGHTDTSGPANYNMALSLRRANTVKAALVRQGVPATSITVVGRGETALLVATRDGVREPQNRRVEIVIQ
jgi:OOP family OmpA-OmpF porin